MRRGRDEPERPQGGLEGPRQEAVRSTLRPEVEGRAEGPVSRVFVGREKGHQGSPACWLGEWVVCHAFLQDRKYRSRWDPKQMNSILIS